MPEYSRRSSQRDTSGPRVVEYVREQPRGSTRRSSDPDRRPARKSDNHRSHKKDSAHRKRPSGSQAASIKQDVPNIELNVISQPAAGIQLGMPVNKAVMISLQAPSSQQPGRPNHIDTSGLFALTSLVADTQDGQTPPPEPSTLCGQKTLDSIHPFPEHYNAALARNFPSRQALGYFSFPDMVIRQAGIYRIRTTLVRMGETGATSLLAVDSEPIRVERHGFNTHRRHDIRL